jgi:Ca2+-binding EF-hand superfamily protein
MGNKSGKNSPNDSELNKKLSATDLNEILSSTSFDVDQIKDWHAGFLKECPRGHMRPKQFIQLYSRLYPNGKSKKFCRHVFRLFDADSSGHISFREFILFVSITTCGQLEKKLALAFNLYDVDNSGHIRKSEIVSLIDAMDELTRPIGSSGVYEGKGTFESKKARTALFEEMADDLIARLDLNGDGRVSREEFMYGCLRDVQLREMLVPYV